jgi:hypothetical protein
MTVVFPATKVPRSRRGNDRVPARDSPDFVIRFKFQSRCSMREYG